MRGFGLDVHRDFCEVAIAEGDRVRAAGRIATRVDALQVFAQSLVEGDVVALEATSGSDKIVSILEREGVRVVVANTRKLKSITDAKPGSTGASGRRAQELAEERFSAGALAERAVIGGPVVESAGAPGASGWSARSGDRARTGVTAAIVIGERAGPVRWGRAARAGASARR